MSSTSNTMTKEQSVRPGIDRLPALAPEERTDGRSCHGTQETAIQFRRRCGARARASKHVLVAQANSATAALYVAVGQVRTDRRTDDCALQRVRPTGVAGTGLQHLDVRARNLATSHAAHGSSSTPPLSTEITRPYDHLLSNMVRTRARPPTWSVASCAVAALAIAQSTTPIVRARIIKCSGH